MWKKILKWLRYHFYETEIHVGTDWQGNYVEVNGERHYYSQSEKIKFKNGWRATIDITYHN